MPAGLIQLDRAVRPPREKIMDASAPDRRRRHPTQKTRLLDALSRRSARGPFAGRVGFVTECAGALPPDCFPLEPETWPQSSPTSGVRDGGRRGVGWSSHPAHIGPPRDCSCIEPYSTSYHRVMGELPPGWTARMFHPAWRRDRALCHHAGRAWSVATTAWTGCWPGSSGARRVRSAVPTPEDGGPDERRRELAEAPCASPRTPCPSP